MYEVECVYPEDKTILQNILTDALAEIVAEKLTPAELKVYIEKLEEQA